MKKFLKFALKPYWKYIVLILIVVIFQTCFQLEIIDIFKASLNFIKKLNAEEVLKMWGWMLLFTLLSALCMCLITYLAVDVSVKVAERTRLKLFHIYNGLSLSDLSGISTSGLMTRTARGVYTEQSFIFFILKFPIFVPFVFLGVLLSLSDLILIIIFGVFVICASVFFYFKLNVLIEYFFKAKKTYGRINFFFRELVLGSKFVRLFNKGDFEIKKYDDALSNSYDKNIDFELKEYSVAPLLLFIFDLFIVIILAIFAFGFDFKILGSIDAVEAIINIQLILYFVSVLSFLPKFIDRYPRAYASSIRLEEILALGDKLIQGSTTFAESNFKGLEFRDVSLDIDGRGIISNVSFKVPEGESVAIVGGISSGKTSLMYLLDGLYDLTSGDIFINGESVKDPNFNPKSKISFAMQKDFIINDTIYNNIVLGDTSISLEDVNYASSLTGLDKVLKTSDFTFDTVIYENGSNISAGFKDDLMLTRSIVRDREIYIFDEHEFRVKNKTNICLTRDISKIKDIPHIIVLDKGKVVGEGTHDELVKTCLAYQKLEKGELL